MKSLLAAFLISFASGAGLGIYQHGAQQPPVAFSAAHSLYEAAAESTVTVRVGDGSGSGVIVFAADGKIYCWTARHVIEDAKAAEVVRTISYGKRKAYELSFNARVLFVGLREDVALLVVDAPHSAFRSAHFAKQTARLGDEIFHIGAALGMQPILTFGHVARVNSPYDKWTEEGGYVDATDALAQPGCSGGPVFNKSGEVIGLLVGMRGTFTSNKLQLYVPISLVRREAKEHGYLF